jgi:hypothetical protein
MITLGPIITTDRGFKHIAFTDVDGTACHVLESSNAEQACIRIGAKDIGLKRLVYGSGWVPIPLDTGIHVANTTMHLSRDMIKELLPVLQHFAETDELPV